MKKTIQKSDNNIESLRRRFGEGLHWVVGDTHGEVQTLRILMEKIKFDPKKDHVYFVGDYNSGGNPKELLKYISQFYQQDHATAGFHLIRGNHERECAPMYFLENMPDILVLRGNVMNYFIAHAGMVSSAFELICKDMADSPKERYFAYSLDERCAGYDAPLRQIIWSRRGLYSQRSRWKNWPDEYALYHNKACIIHGHTPYCFFNEKIHSFYGDQSLFWENQHIWFSEDLQSFDIDSNIKGIYQNGESYRGLSCLCLEALEEIAASNYDYLTVESIINADNFVFSSAYIPECGLMSDGDINQLLNARPKMKNFRLNSNLELFLSDT